MDTGAYAADAWGRPFAMALVSATSGILRAHNVATAMWIAGTGYSITMLNPASDANYGVLAFDSGFVSSTPGAAQGMFVYNNATYPKSTTQFVLAPRFHDGTVIRPDLCFILVYQGA
jgi:hypothetical protein